MTRPTSWRRVRVAKAPDAHAVVTSWGYVRPARQQEAQIDPNGNAGLPAGPVDLTAGTRTPRTPPTSANSLVTSFAGDSLYLSSSDTKPFTIAREETVTTLTATPPTSSIFGQPATFIAVSAADPPGGAPAPTGSTAFAVDATPVGSSVLTGGTGNTATASLRAGPHKIAASYGGDHNFLPSSRALPYTVTCDVNIRGNHRGALVVTTTTCLAAGSRVTGAVIVKPGAALDVESSAATGAILAAEGAGVIWVCGSTVQGAIKVSNSAGLVLIGDPGDASCVSNRVGAALALKGKAKRKASCLATARKRYPLPVRPRLRR